MIEVPLSYNEEDTILVEDDRINPTTYRALFLRVAYDGGGGGYLPLEYLVIYNVSLTPEELELQTPLVIVGDGEVSIIDLWQEIANVAGAFEADRNFIAVLVQGD